MVSYKYIRLMKPESDETLCCFVALLTETPKSYYIHFGDRKEWIPKSVSRIGLREEDKMPIIIMKDWFYEKLGL